MIIAK